jgi:AraC-like DNA-binding protein
VRKIGIKFNFFILILTFGFLPQITSAQTLTEQKDPIIVASEKLVYSNPIESIKIALQLSKSENNSIISEAKINYVLSQAYFIKGDYSTSLKLLFEGKNYGSYLTEKEKIDIAITKIAILRDLSLDKESKKRIDLLELSTQKIANLKWGSYTQKIIVLEKAKLLLKEHQYSKGVELLLAQEQNSKQLFEAFPELELSYAITLGEFYLEQKNLTDAKKQFSIALSIINQQNNINKYAKIQVLLGLAAIHFFQKEHDVVTTILNSAFVDSQNLQNVFLQEKIIQQQNVNYLALNDASKYKLTNANFIQIKANIEVLEQEAVNAAYNLITKEYSDTFAEKKKQYDTVFNYISVLILLLSIVSIFFWVKFTQRIKNLTELDNYLQISKKKIIDLYSEKRQEPKKAIILKETEEQLLIKLKKFENSKRFVNKDISLALLAGQLDTNTKYLSEIINSHYHVNFNTYINRLRINYITEKLKTDPNYIKYRISYLAENCGFASHSSFATVFKSITGISPVKFIDFLKSEKTNSLE